MEIKKYDKIQRFGKDEVIELLSNPEDVIYIQEKMDGANFRFYINNNGVPIFGSRTQQLTSNEGEDTNIAKNFTLCVQHVRNKLKDKDLSDYNGYIFYGECMVKHTLQYDWDNIPRFLGFDIYDTVNGIYLEYPQVEEIYNNLSLDIVPLIDIVYAKDIISVSDKLVPVTKYPPLSNPKQLAEGIVFKNYNKQIIAKYVRDAFKEDNANTFGGKPKYNEDDTINSELVFKFCTNARIEKMIFKLIDNGNNLEMKLMQQLPKLVYSDIMEEEWRYICFSKKKVDFGNLNKLIIKRCLYVLNQVITNNGLQ